MPCKHEGGTDPCEQYASRKCKIHTASYLKQWRKDHPGRQNELIDCPSGKATIYAGGKASELLIEADLLWRGLRVTRPSNPDVKDDLHVLAGGAWRTVQVKSAYQRRSTGRTRVRLKGITSDIIALVIGGEHRIEYRAHKIRKLPEELR
jgi:hypothetical protein